MSMKNSLNQVAFYTLEYRTAAATSRERVSASGNIASIYSVVSSSQGSDKNNTYNNSSHHSDTVSSSTSSHSSSVANLSSSALASVTSGIFGTTLGIVVCALVISATLAIVVGITRRVSVLATACYAQISYKIHLVQLTILFYFRNASTKTTIRRRH